MKHSSRFLLAGLSILAMSLTVGGVLTSKQGVKISVAAESVESYYSSISDTLTGENLRSALNTLNSEKRKSTVGYAGMRQFAKISDIDPDGSGKIISFYDNKLIGPSWDSGATWNREHVWPNIRGGDKVEADAHMVRPAATETNSDRGSKGYSVNSYDPGQFVEYYRGAASRIIFYCMIADLSLNLVEDPLNYNGAGQYPNSMGCLSEMLAWNLQYQPSDTTFTGANDLARRTEINRNNKIQTASGGQGNRNPFIDHPEYACRIWGPVNEKTRAVCGSDPLPPEPEELTGIELNVNEASLEKGESLQLTVSPVPATASLGDLYWGSTNKSVATVSENGLVKALSGGKTNINVATADGKFMLTCVVTVKGAGSSRGCGGNIVTTSVILSTLSLLGIGLICLTRFKKNKQRG